MFDWGGEAEPGPDRHTRYKTAGNIRGDHPLNLCATTLGMNAFLLTGERKYADDRDYTLTVTAVADGKVSFSYKPVK